MESIKNQKDRSHWHLIFFSLHNFWMSLNLSEGFHRSLFRHVPLCKPNYHPSERERASLQPGTRMCALLQIVQLHGWNRTEKADVKSERERKKRSNELFPAIEGVRFYFFLLSTRVSISHKKMHTRTKSVVFRPILPPSTFSRHSETIPLARLREAHVHFTKV